MGWQVATGRRLPWLLIRANRPQVHTKAGQGRACSPVAERPPPSARLADPGLFCWCLLWSGGLRVAVHMLSFSNMTAPVCWGLGTRPLYPGRESSGHQSQARAAFGGRRNTHARPLLGPVHPYC